MGKLNILHHKSYHVYNRDNVARVKRDELRAELEQQEKDQATIASNSESRLNLLRQSKDKLKKDSSFKRERELEKKLDDQLRGGRGSSSSKRFSKSNQDNEIDSESTD